MKVMSKMKIFIDSPISGYSDNEHYICYKKGVLNLIKELRKDHIVYSETEKISDINSYDNPGKSALKDFCKIQESDVFILVHPAKMQTSTFIELGYDIAHNKRIVIVSEKNNLPFLTLGLCDIFNNVRIVPYMNLNDTTIRMGSLCINSDR